MKKLLFLIALLLGIAAAKPAYAACTGSSPNWTAPTWADLQACHTAASNGDVITVTAGSYAVTATTTITKYVKIHCSGTCTITDNVTNVADLINITESTVGHTRLEGFTFVQGTGQHINPNGVINMVYATNGLGILITGNSYASGTTGDFIIAGVNRGVIWGNTATGQWIDTPGVRCSNNVAFVRHKNLGLTSVWFEGPYYGMADSGGDKNLYIENNVLDNVFEGIDVDANARTVIRWNSITNSGVLNHGVDTGDISGRYMEIYNNYFAWSTTAHCSGGAPASVNSFIYLRGAPALIHDNTIDDITGMFWGDKAEITFTDEKLRRAGGTYGCWTGGYPSRQQVGWGYSVGGTQAGTTGEYQDLEPVYLWSNNGGGNYGAPSVVDYSPNGCGGGAPSVATYIVQDREYYLNTAKPSYTSYTYPHPLATTFGAKTIYVNKSGNNGNSCANAALTTDSLAKLTIAAGISCLVAGDTLIVGDGVYAEAFLDPPSGSSGANTIIRAENRNLAIVKPDFPHASGYAVPFGFAHSYITVDGIDADCVNWSASCAPYLWFNTSANHITVQNGKAHHARGDGTGGGEGSCVDFAQGGDGNQVLNMDIYDCGGNYNADHAIYVGGSGHLIHGNRITSTNPLGSSGAGDGTPGGAAIEIQDVVDGNANITISNNIIWDNGTVAIELSGTVDNLVIKNNLIYNNGQTGATDTYFGVSFYNTGSYTDVEIYFNTFYGNKGYCIGIKQEPGSGTYTGGIFRNNICYGNSLSGIESGFTGVTQDHNLTTDPHFWNSAIGDFHLMDDSAALGTGVAVTGITTDLDNIVRPNPPNTNPSIGAYEIPSGAAPEGPLAEDFDSYTATASICSLNDGTGWTQSWACDSGTATADTAPMGMTGKAMRLTNTSDTRVHRLFTAHTGSFTISFTMRISITNPSSGIGVNLLNASGIDQSYAYFDLSGGIYSNSQLLLGSFSVDTNYAIDVDFDTAGHPNEFRTRVNGGPYSSWEACVSTCTSIAGLAVNSFSTNAHTFWLDDISDTTPVGGTITVATPTLAQACTSGSTCAISWSSSGVTGAVNLYYLVNGTEHLIASPDVTATPYTWTVNAPAGPAISVRVSQGAVTDDSDAFMVLGTKLVLGQ